MFFYKARTDLRQVPVSPQDPLPVVLGADTDINIGDVGILGDDAAVIIGSKSDAAWDGSAGSPTWTAIFKYLIARLTSILTQVTTVAGGIVQSTASNLNAQVVGNVADFASDSGNSVKVGGLVSTTKPTSQTTGKRVPQWMGAAGHAMVGFGSAGGGDASNTPALAYDSNDIARPLGVAQFTYNGSTMDRVRSGAAAAALNTGIGSMSVEQVGCPFTRINTATTTTVKSGAGHLKKIIVNAKGTVASTITIYDNTAGSGTVIGVIDSLNLYGTFSYDLAFSTGLTLVTTGTVAPDVTVIYR